MNLTRTFAIFLRQLYLYRSNPARLSSVFLWLVVDIIQWGFISRYLGSFGKSTFGFLTVILGAIILWGFMSRIQQGIMTSFLEDIWSQNFINFFASPLRIVEYLSGLVLTSITTGLFGFVMVVAIAGLGFGYNFFMIGLFLLPFMIILFIFGIAMGIFVSGVIFRLGPTAEWLGWPIPLVLSIFSGVYYPVSTLPIPFQIVSRLVPASYVFESMRGVLTSQSAVAGVGLNLVLGGTLALAYLGLAYAFFVKIYRRNLRNGAIAKFSAET
jgi:ABC-2 type transport system permease protein